MTHHDPAGSRDDQRIGAESRSGVTRGRSRCFCANSSGWLVVLCLVSLVGCDTSPRERTPQLEVAEIEVAPPRADADETGFPHQVVAGEDGQDDVREAPSTSAVTSFRLPEPIEIPPKAVLDATRLSLIETETVTIVTDLSSEEIEPLTTFVDKVWPNLKTVFGPLRDDVPVDVRPLTAFVVQDVDSFAQAGVLPRTLSTKIHGQHRGWQFWMRWPTSKYYQRHLFSHEAAHCYSMITSASANPKLDPPQLPSGWLESIAEWFATHSDSDSGVEFGTVPMSSGAVPGWGRIELLREDLASGRRYSAVEVAEMKGDLFQGVPTAYAWAWALSALLDATDREAFRSLLNHTTQGTCGPYAVRQLCRQLDDSGVWAWWLEAVEYGVDPRLTMPRVVAANSQISARQGWQTRGEILAPGEVLRLSAEGLVVLGESGRPWMSTPDGIRLDYADGHPIGKLMVRTLNRGAWSPPVAIGVAGTYRSDLGGEVFFRVNDHWNSLDDNRGEFSVAADPASGE